MISELDLIRRIREQAAPEDADLLKGIGDDCAVFAASGAESLTLVTTDTLVEGVHFDLSWHPPVLLGHKAVAVNVSDIAAMGGTPRFALLSLAAPAAIGAELLEPFMQGFMAGLARYRVTLIGGDTVRSDQGLVLSVTILGEVGRQQVVYRSGAHPGDQIWVSGFLGQAAAGLEICRQGAAGVREAYPELVQAHLEPLPEVALGPALAGTGLVTAMIDMSDGLASDLAHICEESGVGALVDAEALPVSEATREAARLFGLDPLRWAIAGGEDYRLLFTAPAAVSRQIEALARHSVGGRLVRVGEIVAGQGVILRSAGRESTIGFQGYDHFGGEQV
jgi:thiamine-monophosphate kinase